MLEQKKYTAFISYNSLDDKWAKWLQKKLEGFRLPSIIAGDDGTVLKRYEPSPERFRIFRYKTDLVTLSLTTGLRRELDLSSYLIVICSPNSACSQWVGREIEHFIKTGRKDRIIPFIVEGKPYSGDEDECFHPVLKAAFPEEDLLGVSLEDVGDDPGIVKRRKAVAKVVSLLIDTPDAFSFIWNRYKRNLIVKTIIRYFVGSLFVTTVLMTLLLSRPFDAQVSVQEAEPVNEYLPALRDVKLLFEVGDNKRTFSMDSVLMIPSLPRGYLGKECHIVLNAKYFRSVDTVVQLARINNLCLSRDEFVFGHIDFMLWKDKPLSGVRVVVGGVETISDREGRVKLDIDLPSQRAYYSVKADIPLQDSVITMPHTPSTVILAK